MGPYRLYNNIYLIIVLLIIPLCKTQTEWCPSDCTCFTLTGRQLQNHAKCTSLNGLLEKKNLPIHSLDLSHTNLTKINHLDKLRVLKTINLSYNKLSDIGNIGQRVKSINLSHNKLTSAKLINIPKYIEDLDLSYNEITYLPLELTKMKLRKLELNGNKINCTCDTIEVRNWLTENSVYTTYPVKCTYPIELKDMLWMRIKQETYCNNHNNHNNHNNSNNNNNEKEKLHKELLLINKDNDNNYNDLMLADAQIMDGNSEEKYNTEVNEELGKDYMPLNTNTDTVIDDNVEGSGLSHLPMQQNENNNNDNNETKLNEYNNDNKNEDENENEEGSGSGMGISNIPIIDTNNSNDSDINGTTENLDDINYSDNEKSNSDESTPIPVPTDNESASSTSTSSSTENFTIFGFDGLGIFGIGKSNDDDSNNSSTSDSSIDDDDDGDKETNDNETNNSIDTNGNDQLEVTESIIVPQHIHENESDNVDIISNDNIKSEKDDMTVEADIDKAEAGENNSTYILIGTIVLILICLIMYVSLKKTIAKRKKRNDNDTERAAELIDMDKKNLGKPLQKNGHEQKPLILNENSKPTLNGNSKKPYTDIDDKINEPLLNGNHNHKDPNDNESNNNIAKSPNQEQQSNKAPVPEPRQSLQNQSPRVHSPRFGNYPPPKSPRSPSDHTDSAGTASSPSSPKTGRYSPVYSPETGKVKIKLTEVPKPKTPMLVTKSRSNAGEIVTTPTSDVVDSVIKIEENQ